MHSASKAQDPAPTSHFLLLGMPLPILCLFSESNLLWSSVKGTLMVWAFLPTELLAVNRRAFYHQEFLLCMKQSPGLGLFQSRGV